MIPMNEWCEGGPQLAQFFRILQLAKVIDRINARQGLMLTRLSQQGTLIATTQVALRVTEINDAGLGLTKLRIIREVLIERDRF